LFNSLNKTVTGALNTLITQQQQQQQGGPWQPVGQQFSQSQQQFQQQQYPQQTATTATPVQQFLTAAVPQAVPVTPATAVFPPQPPQQPPGAPRLPSDASSAFVRVGPAVNWQARPDGLPSQHRPPPEYHHVAPVRDHIQQQPPIALSQHLTNGDEIYRELPRNHVDPRMHLAPADRGEYNFNNTNFNSNSLSLILSSSKLLSLSSSSPSGSLLLEYSRLL